MSSNFATELYSPRRWSLTARLTLFFSAAIAVIVIGVSAMMYAQLVQSLHEKEEAELRDDLRIQADVLAQLARRTRPSQWQHEWGEYQVAYRRFAWQLVAPDGRVEAASPNAAQFAAGLAGRGGSHGFVRVADERGAADRHFLQYSIPLKLLPTDTHWLRGALDVSRDEQVLQRYLSILSGVVVLAVVLSAAVGWVLVRRGLAPVRAISTEIGRVNAERLHSRIANEAWPSDLRELAGTFDDMLARIERSFEQLARFSSDLAHEFRSPINNLVAAASVTLTRARNPSEYQNTLEVVVDEGSRLSRMVSSMLFLARAENAQQLLRCEPVSTQVEFGKLVDFFEIVAEEKGVSIQTEGACELHADPLLLRRALSNLLTNALRYTPSGGTIRLVAKDAGDRIAISVIDNGAGIGAQHLPFLFDRFYRADAARSSADSTGLGLAVVRSIVELHGGSVSVHSGVGTGSTFALSFPKGLTQPC
jgi:two-component system heavy metal sensor histidine kinase CusS